MSESNSMLHFCPTNISCTSNTPSCLHYIRTKLPSSESGINPRLVRTLPSCWFKSKIRSLIKIFNDQKIHIPTSSKNIIGSPLYSNKFNPNGVTKIFTKNYVNIEDWLKYRRKFVATLFGSGHQHFFKNLKGHWYHCGDHYILWIKYLEQLGFQWAWPRVGIVKLVWKNV